MADSGAEETRARSASSAACEAHGGPSGRIIDCGAEQLPRGMTVLEYSSPPRARKGSRTLPPHATRLLTRRLVDVAQDVIPARKTAAPGRQLDHPGRVAEITSNEKGIPAPHDRPLSAADLIHPKTGEVIVERTRSLPRPCAAVDESGIDEVSSDRLSLRSSPRCLPPLLRPQPCQRHAGRHRRSRGHHRRPVDREPARS